MQITLCLWTQLSHNTFNQEAWANRGMGLQSSEVHTLLLQHPRTPTHQDFCPGAGEAAAAPDCRAPVRFMARKSQFTPERTTLPLKPVADSPLSQRPDSMHQDLCPGAGEAAVAPDCRAPVRFMARKGCAAAAATSRRSACLYARHLHAALLFNSPVANPQVDVPTDALLRLHILSPWKADSRSCVGFTAALCV